MSKMATRRTLRDRCAAFLAELNRNAITKYGNPVDDLTGFVRAETARKEEPSLDAALSLILFFDNAEDRDEFLDLMRKIKPDMRSKKLP